MARSFEGQPKITGTDPGTSPDSGATPSLTDHLTARGSQGLVSCRYTARSGLVTGTGFEPVTLACKALMRSLARADYFSAVGCGPVRWHTVVTVGPTRMEKFSCDAFS